MLAWTAFSLHSSSSSSSSSSFICQNKSAVRLNSEKNSLESAEVRPIYNKILRCFFQDTSRSSVLSSYLLPESNGCVQFLLCAARGGSSPKILGKTLSHQPLHNRVHFIRSPKPKKIRTPYRPTFEIYRSCNILNRLKIFSGSFWIWRGQQVNLGVRASPALRVIAMLWHTFGHALYVKLLTDVVERWIGLGL